MELPLIDLLVADIDGTLLDSHHQLSAGAARAAQAAARAGVRLVLATGRRHRFALPVTARLEVEAGAAPWIIACNGADVRDGTGAVHSARLLPSAVAAKVLGVLDEFRHQAVLTFAREGIGELVMETLADGLRAFPGWLEKNLESVRFCQPLEDALECDPIQIMFGGGVAEMAAAVERLRAAPVAEQIRIARTVYPRRDLAIVDILHPDVSKGAALRRLAAGLGIGAARIMAIGDNHNDVEMLEFAGFPVVMGNAEPELHRPHWARTLDNDHDGFAAAVARVIPARYFV